MLNKFKLNIPVRFKNPWFWISLLGTILAAIGAEPSMFTSWDLVYRALVGVLTNPFQLGCVIVAVLGVIIDPTTAGIGDSKQALTYTCPKKDKT